MFLTVRAIVLRVSDYNDRDALLTVLTEHYGKLTIKVRAYRRGCEDEGCRRHFYTVNEAHALEIFKGLRRELTQLSLGSYFAQVAELISQEDLPNPELQALLLNCLYALSELHKPEPLVKSVFELRAACLAGYTPELFGCHVCGSQTPDRFDLNEGRLECRICRDPSSQGIRVPVTADALEAMRYICLCSPKRLFSFRLGADGQECLSGLTEGYLATQLEHGFPTLDFYHSLYV